jgi:hypothetical protein
MDQNDLLRYLIDSFEKIGIQYFIVGSIASSAYGEPRFTLGIDVVADIHPSQIPLLVQHFPFDEYYLSEEAISEAIRSGNQFNIIHPTSGLKIDVIVRRDDELDESQFRRRKRMEALPGREAYFASPEDVILKKMNFYKMGESEKHLRDITGILEISGAEIDQDYIEEWAKRLGLTEIWEAIIKRVEKKGD